MTTGGKPPWQDAFGILRPLDGAEWFYSLPALALAQGLGVDIDAMPVSIKVLLENLARCDDGSAVVDEDVVALAGWPDAGVRGREFAFHPSRVLMPDSSGVPLLVDLAAMRDAMAARGLDPRRVDPLVRTDLVIDHSVRVDFAGRPDAAALNLQAELDRNHERYGVVKWAQGQYDNLHVVPPGNGIVHQINIENLAEVVCGRARDGYTLLYPDTLVGMDSHTPMVNALGVFGWGVGGIEAATAMFGQPVSLRTPDVVGCRLVGTPPPGVMCTDIVLALTKFLRGADVLAAIVEFCGPALVHLSLPDRATIANMAAEYGATMGFFPIDGETLRYLRQTGRPAAHVERVERYARAQGLWRGDEPRFERLLEFDLGAVEPAIAGPSRPEQLVRLADAPQRFRTAFAARGLDQAIAPATVVADRPLESGDVVIASIASCTNTANPYQMVAAGLLARKAIAAGLACKPWVKTSLSPGSRVVPAMLAKAGLQDSLDQLGFNVVGFGCMSCGSGSGKVNPGVAEAVAARDLTVTGVISTNRNFEGRLNAAVRGTFLASPPLVVAYAIAGSILVDLTRDPLGEGADGTPVFLADIWPAPAEIQTVLDQALTADLFGAVYAAPVALGSKWTDIAHSDTPRFAWDPASMAIRRPPFLDAPSSADARAFGGIHGARLLLLLGDDVTTDHISPGSAIPPDTEAGVYLAAHGVAPDKFGTYISRRANHEVMVRGTFANVRLRNALVPGREGGFTRHQPSGDSLSVFAAAERYSAEGTPVVVVAGRNYGNGSSRDWAAKGTSLLGVRAVIAESFERIHRSNLVGMGVLPLQFLPGVRHDSLGLDGSETIDIPDLDAALSPGAHVQMVIHRADGRADRVALLSRVDTRREAEWVRAGGVLPFVLEALAA